MFYKEVAEKLMKLGFEVFLVGGALRDEYLNKEPHDYDLMIKGTLKDLVGLSLNDITIVPTGLKYGIVKAIKPTTLEEVDISVPRLEFNYDGRRPQLVKTAKTIEEDLIRRDFTINSMAKNLKTGEVIDLFGGVNDIKNKIIRCNSKDTAKILRDDALRIMRAVRFKSTLNFNIDDEIHKSVLNPEVQKALHTEISNERFRDELCRILEETEDGNLVVDAINLLLEYGVLDKFLPEISALNGVKQNIHHDYDVLGHTLEALKKTKPNLIVRLSVLFHDVGKPKTQGFKNEEYGHTFYDHQIVGAFLTEEILNRIALGGYKNSVPLDIKRIKRLIWNHLSFNKIKTSKLLRKLDIDRFGTIIIDQLYELMMADIQGRDHVEQDRLEAITKKRDNLKSLLEVKVTSRKDLLITGTDIIDLGFNKGPIIRKVINTLLSEVLENKTKNDRHALLDRVYLMKINKEFEDYE